MPDGGRTWNTHTFTGTDTDYRKQPFWPRFATYDGHTAYVVVPRHGAEVVYRSADAGLTWTAGGTVDGGNGVDQLTVRPDGTLAQLSGAGAPEYASTDGGRSFHRLIEDHPDAVPIPGGYAQQAPSPVGADPFSIVLWLSPDLVRWTGVPFPNP